MEEVWKSVPIVLKIRSENQIGDAELAKQYGVSRAAVNMARTKKTWRHV